MKKELEYLQALYKKTNARNRKTVINKINKCLDVLSHDEFVSQYIGYIPNALRLNILDLNNGIVGTAIKLISPIYYYRDDSTGERKQCSYLNWVQCLDYDVEKYTFEKILKKVSIWAEDILLKLQDQNLETELLRDYCTWA